VRALLESILIDVQSKRSNVKFYDYGSFEWMLFYSSFIKGTTRSDSFNFPTLEKYYEKLLEDATKGFPFEYKHGEPLSPCYLKECENNCCCDKFCIDKFKAIVGSKSCLLKSELAAMTSF